jgi:hypothetical protein
MTIEEIYHESIKTLATSERFRLATLILSEIPPQRVVDIRDVWNEEDLRDISAYSARLFTGVRSSLRGPWCYSSSPRWPWRSSAPDWAGPTSSG